MSLSQRPAPTLSPASGPLISPIGPRAYIAGYYPPRNGSPAASSSYHTSCLQLGPPARKNPQRTVGHPTDGLLGNWTHRLCRCNHRHAKLSMTVFTLEFLFLYPSYLQKGFKKFFLPAWKNRKSFQHLMIQGAIPLKRASLISYSLIGEHTHDPCLDTAFSCGALLTEHR